MTERKVCVGAVIGAKGVRGEVKIKSFTATPGDIGSYGPVTTEDGRSFRLRVSSWAKDVVTAQLAGVADRNAAEALTGVKLYVERAALPAAEDGSYYHADLIGLAARLVDGEKVGKVSAVFNFGAGDVLEVTRPDGGTELIPFSGAAVAGVDLAAGTVTITPLPGLFEGDLSTAVEGEAE